MNKDPLLHPEHASIIQEFGELLPVRLGLSAEVRHQGVAAMNRLLAHSTALRDLYKKSHWQTSDGMLFELHKLFDKHHD